MIIYILLIATLLVILLERTVYQLFGLRSLGYTAYFDAVRATEGDEIHFVEVIRNRARIPMPWVRVESAFDLQLRFRGQAEKRIRRGSQYHQFHYSVFSLAARTKITRTHEVTCDTRGEYFLTGAAVTMGDLFGLHRDTKEIPLDVELIVYPQILDLGELPLPIHRWLGDMVVRRSMVDDPFSISGVREYMPGDPLGLVNWKATAHASQMMVHRRDFTADSELLIYLNVEDTENMWNKVSHPELIERGIRYAAAAARFAIDNGMKVGWVSNGTSSMEQRTPVLSGTAHLEHILESMARLKIERAGSFSSLIREDVGGRLRNHDILVLTTYVDSEMEAVLKDMKSLANEVQVVNLRELAEVKEAMA